MFFEVNTTPKDKKGTSCTIAETNFNLVLAPFQPQTRIELQTPVNTTVQCCLNIQNPSNRSLHVAVTKVPAEERAIVLSLNELTVEAGSEFTLGISWTPKEAGTWRDTIQLTDNRRIKYEIPLITSAIGPKKDIKKSKQRGQKSLLSGTNITSAGNRNKNGTKLARVTTKSPPKKRPESKRILGWLEKADPPRKKVKSAMTFASQDKENISANIEATWVSPEKTSAVQTPCKISHDFSAFIDSTTFNITPLRPKVQCENTETESTEKIQFVSHGLPILSPTSTESKPLRRETYLTAPTCRNISFCTEDVKDEFEDSLSPQDCRENLKSDFSILINGMNLTSANTPVMPSSIFSPQSCSTGNKSVPESSRLSAAESVNSLTGGNRTFDIPLTKSANNSYISEANGTYELPASPTRSGQVRRVRLSTNFAMLSPVIPENNPSRMGRISTSPMSADLRSGNDSFSVKSQLDSSERLSAQDVLEANLWVKPVANLKGVFGSLERIMEELPATEISVTTNKTYTEDRRKTCAMKAASSSRNVRIEISPPKRNPSVRTGKIRRVSPKKNSRVCKDKSIQESVSLKKKICANTSIKSGNKLSIPGTRITKLSLAGVSRKKNHNNSMEAYQPEVSVKLHDPDDFLTRLCNPDPFSASTTEDPFLTSSVYCDEEWVYNQEVEFKKWLNALLTPPEHLTADVDTACVDVAKVWQSCRMKDVTLAETREAVSARYHTNVRLNTLRKAACMMLRSNEVTAVLSRVTVCVEKGILVVRQDRDLYKDIGLQKEVLELFLCYNPLWLRIGLEAVYGETIPLSSNNDLVGLTKFLLGRFFSDPYIIKTHSHPAVMNLRLPTFTPIMNKFMLKKFLFVIYFLDYAKRKKLIAHDPCLFHKRAVHKESREILLTFSRELLSGVGDITKVLRPYGYVLLHKQTYLDEYDYAVVDLCTDLRDGVRLCRVMELITGKRNLTSRSRVPAISRLQKVHNVDVALTALHQSGYSLLGDIDAKSIADGHREKTLSLLWQIIYKVQAPRFHKAATTLQKWWRSKLWWVRVRNFLRGRRENAASVIQRAWRCHLARLCLQELRKRHILDQQRKDGAARVIQSHWLRRRQMQRERKIVQQRTACARTIQNWWRNRQATKPFVDDLKQKRNAVLVLQQRWHARKSMLIQRAEHLSMRESTVKIQLWWKRKRVQRAAYADYQKIKKATECIQVRWRSSRLMKVERERYREKLRAIETIQKWWRSVSATNKARSNFMLMKHAVHLIEKWWFDNKTITIERQEFLLQRNSAVKIQKSWRRHRATRDASLHFRICQNSCRKIQAWWRGAFACKQYELKRGSCLIIQRFWRNAVLKRTERARYLAIRESAITIQKNWRMKKARQDYLQMKRAVLTIESWYSRATEMVRTRNSFLETILAVVDIQYWWRNLQLSKMERNNYLQYRKTVIWVQSQWRANQLAKKARETYLLEKRSICKIQTWWRMTRQRKKYLAVKKSVLMVQRTYRQKKRLESVKRNEAAVVLQNRWRAILAARQQRISFERLKAFTITVQRRWREKSMAQRIRNNFIAKRKAAIVVQKNWRSFVDARKFSEQKRAAVVIQLWWRNLQTAMKARHSFLSLRNAAVCLQQRFRARKLAMRTREEYISFKKNVVTLQRRWRALKIGRDIRQQYLVQRHMVITIQSKWRMVLAMRKYRMQREAVHMIQSWWRSHVVSKKTRFNYLSLKYATIALQRRYRANKTAANVKREFLALKKNVVLVQCRWRTKRLMQTQMQEFHAKREAAITIQRWCRSVLAMRVCQNRYKEQKAAVITIQKWYRSSITALKIKRMYGKYKSSVETIQRWWRQILLKKQQSLQLQAYKNAVSIIEQWWMRILNERHILALAMLKNKKEESAAIMIQAVWRGYKIRRVQCDKLKELRLRAEIAKEKAMPSATMAYRLQEAMFLLQSCDSLGNLARGLSAIDTIVRLLPMSCMQLCKANLVVKIYQVFARANRSLPWINICVRTASILITLAKFPPSKPYVWQDKYIQYVIAVLAGIKERESELFLHLTTLLWLLAENPEHAEAIVQTPQTTRVLSSMYSAVSKKKPRLSSLSSSRTVDQTALLPNPKPDWGGLTQNRPRLFTSVHHAVTALCKRLKIKPSA